MTGAKRAVLRIAGSRIGSLMGADASFPVAALTYDDGPDEVATPRLLDLLAAARVKATFFVLAGQVDAYPELARAILSEGHEIALHGNDHRLLADLPAREIVRSLTLGKRRVEAVTGAPLTLYRPPYGYQNAVSYTVARTLRMLPVGWSADGDDWLELPPAEVAARVMTDLRPGGIVLLHDRCEPLPGEGPGVMAPNLNRAEVLRELLAMAEGTWSFTSVSGLRQAAHPIVRPWFGG